MMQNPEDRQRTIQNVQMENTEGGFAFMVGVGLSSRNATNRNDKLTFLLDSEATEHLINQKDAFSDSIDLSVPVKIIVAKKNETILETKRGTISVITNRGISGVLEHVLYAPEVPYNLLSVRQIQQAGTRVIFDEKRKTTIEKNKIIIATGKSMNNPIIVDLIVQKKMCNNTIVNINTYKLCYERLGYMDKSKFLKIKRNNMYINDKKLKNINPTSEICEACIYGKQARLSFSKETNR